MEDTRRWERVLQAVEAESRRAQALLTALRPAAEDEQIDDGEFAVAASWLLPSAEATTLPTTRAQSFDAFNPAAGATPPAPEQMPPVPEELRERIGSLLRRIHQLQEELAGAIREWRPIEAPQRSRPIHRPLYLDREL